MSDTAVRAGRTSGFRVVLAGGAALAVLMIVLDPVTTFEQCPNYGGNGNASVFEDEAWDFYLLLGLPAWLLLIVVEQFLPATRRGRDPVNLTFRALGALTVAVVVSCLVGRLLILCS